MDIRKDILLKHLEQAAIEQIETDYQNQGYEVMREPRNKPYDIGADLIAKRGDEIIVFEVKAGKWENQKRSDVKLIRNKAVHELGARFNIVFVNLPDEPEIEIEGLEQLFFELLPEELVDEFSMLATHFWIDEVSDISIENIGITKSEIEVVGTGIVGLGLQSGSDGDYRRGDGLRFTESYPFHFHISLHRNLELKEVHEIYLDAPDEDDE